MVREEATVLLAAADVLMRLSRALVDEGFPVSLHQPAMQSNSLQGLSIALPKDLQGRTVPLFLTLKRPFENRAQRNACLLQFVGALPFRVESGRVADTVRVVLLLNSLIELSGFGFEPTQRLVTFRHTLITGIEPDAASVVDCVHLVSDTLHSYGRIIEGVALGEKTLDRAYREAQALA